MQVPTCIERLRRYAKGALEPTTIPLPPAQMPSTALAAGGLIGAQVVRQPVGVVACITPYNFPIVNMAGKVGPALAMGNTVVVKPAPQDPLAVTVFGEILDDAGFPPGVVNVVVGSGAEVGEAITSSPSVDMVSFTGSTVVGQRIGEVCGRSDEAPAHGARRQGGGRSCSTTPTCAPPSPPSRRSGPSTRARSAPRRRGSSPSAASTSRSSKGSPRPPPA